MSTDRPEKPDTPPTVRVGRLDSTAAVRDELGKLYRASRRKAGAAPTPSDAARLAFILKEIGTSLLARELEDRIAAIEARQGGRP